MQTLELGSQLMIVPAHAAAVGVVSCGHGLVDEFDLSQRWLCDSRIHSS